MKIEGIKIIAFDADDTLWVNEPHYQYCEEMFTEIIRPFAPGFDVRKELIKTDIQNVDVYGYGVKGFLLSMIETALRISGNDLRPEVINEIITLGKSLYSIPLELLDGVEEVLKDLKSSYKLVLATKGDLLDQQRKLRLSGLSCYFESIEVMSEKKEEDYLNILRKENTSSEHFLMVGNSIKSDIIPVLNIGSWAVHVPFHVTWEHEKTEKPANSERLAEIKCLSELRDILL
jgi:putative hydrolase of the HAD superfamily